jgi:hypothetical protein
MMWSKKGVVEEGGGRRRGWSKKGVVEKIESFKLEKWGEKTPTSSTKIFPIIRTPGFSPISLFRIQTPLLKY